MSASPTAPSGLPEAREACYLFIRAALAKPSPTQHAWMLGEEFRRGLALLCEQLAVPDPGPDLIPAEYADFESRYIACFEVGLPEPPVVLQASHYARHEPAPRVVHEHILFSRHFGHVPDGATGEAADHVLNELDFLIHLDHVASRGHADPASLDRARRDFLSRHPGRWVRQAADRAAERGLPVLYRTLLALLAAAVEEDLAWVEAVARGDEPAGRPT